MSGTKREHDIEMRLRIERVGLTYHATYGVLLDEDLEPICLTLEDPWLDNQPNISCIPAGHYLCRKFQSPRFGDTYKVAGVVGRTGIIFHVGNWAGKPGTARGANAGDTQGCILLGKTFGRITWKDHSMGLYQSRTAIQDFMRLLDGRLSFQLEIR